MIENIGHTYVIMELKKSYTFFSGQTGLKGEQGNVGEQGKLLQS